MIALLTLRLSAACAAGMPRLDLGQVRRDALQPVEVARVRAGERWSCRLLRHLRQEGVADAALVEQREHRVELLGLSGLDAVAAQVGDLARRLVGGAARSASRRRFSISTTRSVVGSAHSSPSVSSRVSW